MFRKLGRRSGIQCLMMRSSRARLSPDLAQQNVTFVGRMVEDPEMCDDLDSHYWLVDTCMVFQHQRSKSNEDTCH